MSESQKKALEQQLWNIANELRGKMDADEFRDYILGFIFYKYLSEKQYLYANTLLETEEIKDYLKVTDADDLEAIKEGVTLNDGLVPVDKIEMPNADNHTLVGIEIHLGRNRIVRRLFEHLGYEVTKLDRTSFAGLTKKQLNRGQFRFLSEKEVGFLKMI